MMAENKRSGESVDHLFLYCSMALDLLALVFSMFGMQWVMPRTVLELFSGWLGRHNSLLVWKMVPHCLVWCLWRERNARHFEDSKHTTNALKLFFFHTLFDWVVGSGAFSIHFIWS
jgi:hypothetical protein